MRSHQSTTPTTGGIEAPKIHFGFGRMIWRDNQPKQQPWGVRRKAGTLERIFALAEAAGRERLPRVPEAIRSDPDPLLVTKFLKSHRAACIYPVRFIENGRTRKQNIVATTMLAGDIDEGITDEADYLRLRARLPFRGIWWSTFRHAPWEGVWKLRFLLALTREVDVKARDRIVIGGSSVMSLTSDFPRREPA